MKYVVSVNGRDVEVVITSKGVELGGECFDASLEELEGSSIYVLRVGDTQDRLLVRRGPTRGQYTLSLAGFRFELEALDERSRAARALAAKATAASGPAPLSAPMPGMIIRLNVQEGDKVHVGQGLVVMEAMKMENELRASAPGTVRRVLVSPGTAVEKGTLLLELE